MVASGAKGRNTFFFLKRFYSPSKREIQSFGSVPPSSTPRFTKGLLMEGRKAFVGIRLVEEMFLVRPCEGSSANG